MKKLLLSFFTMMIVFGAFAQDRSTAQQTTDEMVKLYDLDTKQTQQMLVIQERRIRNLDQLVGMEKTDVKKYRHKRRAIAQSTDASIRRMLKEEQMETYKKKRLEWRQKRAERVVALKATGISKEEIEDALLNEGF